MHYDKLILNDDTDEYAEMFVSASAGGTFRPIEPFAWRKRDAVEVFIADAKEPLLSKTIQNFFEMPELNGKVIECHLNRPITVEAIPLCEEPKLIVKLIYVANDVASCVVGPKDAGKNVGQVVCIEEYSNAYQDEFITRFLSDSRVKSFGPLYRDLYKKAVEAESPHFKDTYIHLYVVFEGRVVAYVGAEHLSKYMYRKNIFFINFLWIERDVHSTIRDEIRRQVDRWILRHNCPMAAAIFINNRRSQRYFSRLGFQPRVVRYTRVR